MSPEIRFAARYVSTTYVLELESIPIFFLFPLRLFYFFFHYLMKLSDTYFSARGSQAYFPEATARSQFNLLLRQLLPIFKTSSALFPISMSAERGILDGADFDH